MAGDGVMEFGDWIIKDALQRNPCVKVPEFPDELTCLKLDESDVSVEWRVYVPKGSECSECKERRGYYLDAETIQRQQKHIAQLERENAEALRMLVNQAATIKGQIDGLHARDELIRDLWPFVLADGASEAFAERMREIGIEVDE